MTTEEKAKAYDGALEKAKEMINNNCPSETTREVCEELFPELKESLDEKTRKFIVECIKELQKSDYASAEFNADCGLALFYLEKQKNLFESGTGLYYYDGEKTTYCGCPATEVAIEQQKEQKPAEWSEEDEEWLDYFERLLEFGYNKDPHNLGKLCFAGKMWLKSLRPQPHWKPSEEQMNALQDAIEEAEHERLYGLQRCLVDLMEDLKKL